MYTGVAVSWQKKRLGELCEVIAGQSPEGRFYNSAALGMPFYQGKKDFGEKFIKEARTWTTQVTKLAREGDILISVRAPVGPVNFAASDVCIGRGLAAIRVDPALNRDFLFYQLVEMESVISGTEGAVFASINKSQIESLPIACPAYDEQERIVSILNQAFKGIATAIANAKQNVQNARAIFQSAVEGVLTDRRPGWLEMPLSEVCDIKHGFAFKSAFFSNGGRYILLTPGNFYESGGYRDRGEKQKYYSGDIPSGFILSKGDLLVAMTEQAPGLLGSPILVPESDRFLHNQRLGLVTKKANAPWTNEFFFHVFNTQAVRRAIHESASGVKVRHTSPSKIGEVVVSFPPSIDEQNSIVGKLRDLKAKTTALESVYVQKLVALTDLKKSILHRAFTGQL